MSPFIVYCGPCAQSFTFPSDGALAQQHARGHGTVIEYSDETGFAIAPERKA